MKKPLFVGLVLIFSVFLFCVGATRTEAASASSASVNKEIDASNIGVKTVHKIVNRVVESYASWEYSNNNFAGGFAYSPDGQYLLYTQTLPKRGGKQIVIINVVTRKITKAFNTAKDIDSSAWSPDGQRIFTCNGNNNVHGGGFSIYEIKSGKHTEVDTQMGCKENDIALWYASEKILIRGSVFNLDSLSFTDISTEEASKIVQKLKPNNLGKAHFYLGETHFANIFYLGISNDDESFGKVLAEEKVDSYALSPKYDSIAFSRPDGLYLAFLDTNVKTEMNYSVDSFRDSLPDDMKSAYTSLMSKNELFVGEVYAPKINPLNGKVVGYEGEAKGEVKIIGESNGKVIVQKIFERTPFKVGKDVISNIKAPKYVMQFETYSQVGAFHLNIWSTLHSISGKELGAIKEGQLKQKEVARAASTDWMKKGQQSLNAGDMQGAIETFSKAIELDATFAYAYWYRGYVYSMKGRLDEAIKDYSKAIELAPNDAELYVSRGKAYYNNREHNYSYQDMAIKDFSKAIELGPNNAGAYSARGVVYMVNGAQFSANKQNACSDLKKACELGECENYKIAKQKRDCE